QEQEACRLHTDLLERYGFSVERGFLGIPTAYRAVFKSHKPGPDLAFLAEYDALPELGHGCGHNLIGALSCAAGIALTEFASECGGNIYVFGCPGEETNGAKVVMSEHGCFDHMTAAMMAHPYAVDGYSSATLAIDALQFEYFGRTAHAASCPEEGINALDACIHTFNKIEALRGQLPKTARVHGVITHGGVSANVIPDYACAKFYVRDIRRADLTPLTKQVIQFAQDAAAECGATVQITNFEYSNDDLATNEALSALFTKQLRLAGFSGELLSDINGGSSDIGNVSYRCPAIQAWFGIGEGKELPLHTRDFAEAAGTSAALKKALLYAKAFVLTGIHLMQHPESCDLLRKEFEELLAARQ
ncbi:MAG: peptidase dimerization domain-containing protein, partial [Lachnospiraceae bacterium]|nr:peptidase dimerization domain-containing protein [Lachnospiraceae bacterium]